VTDLVERLRKGRGFCSSYDTDEAADEIEKLRGIIREAMSELLIAQEDNQMSSAGYRGEWLGDLIALCQRGLENREAPK
jgi:hypothetical protein